METDNKEKLTLKELAGYLPYRLKVFRDNKSLPSEIFTIVGATEENVFTQQNGLALVSFDRIKPVLRPLSDLTKEITHNGETFVPIVEICRLSETVNNVLRLGVKSHIVGFDYENSMSEKLRFCYHVLTKHFGLLNLEDDNYESILHQHDMFQKLYEWHFDIHGLIERNLAIDINTLPNE